MPDTLEEEVAAKLPGWSLVAESREDARGGRAEDQTPDLHLLKAKYGLGVGHASIEKDASPCDADAVLDDGVVNDGELGARPQHLTGSALVKRDGQTLRVDYLLATLEIVSIQG